MRPSAALTVHREAILALARLNHVHNVRVFGSTANGHDTETSDLDLLVDPLPETTLLDIARLQNTLQNLLGVATDVVTPRALPPSFRERVLASAVPL